VDSEFALFSVTALVFLAAAAWAGIVAADFLPFSFGRVAGTRRYRVFAVAQHHPLRPWLLDLDFSRDGLTAVDDMLNAEIYSPPYLFKGTRPAITTAPNLVSYNSSFSIVTPDRARIATVSLLPLGSVTHHLTRTSVI
jgi:hypothetical protein